MKVILRLIVQHCYFGSLDLAVMLISSGETVKITVKIVRVIWSCAKSQDIMQKCRNKLGILKNYIINISWKLSQHNITPTFITALQFGLQTPLISHWDNQWTQHNRGLKGSQGEISDLDCQKLYFWKSATEPRQQWSNYCLALIAMKTVNNSEPIPIPIH